MNNMGIKSITNFAIIGGFYAAMAGAAADASSPCPIPVSAPQLSIVLESARLADRYLNLSLSSRTADLSRRLIRFLLVPAQGPIFINQVTARELSTATNSQSG